MQVSGELKSAMLEAVEPTLGAGATLEIRSGAVPASTAAPDTGSLLVSINLPGDWLETYPGSDLAVLHDVWSGIVALSGTASYFRIKDSLGVAHIQGTVYNTLSGAGDLGLDFQVGTNLTAGRTFTVTSFDLLAL